jgi:hypothetical protein
MHIKIIFEAEEKREIQEEVTLKKWREFRNQCVVFASLLGATSFTRDGAKKSKT